VAGVLALAARAEPWHFYGQTGFTAPTGWQSSALLALSGAVAVGAGLAAVWRNRTTVASVRCTASLLLLLLLDQLVSLGHIAEAPDSGAWLATFAALALVLGLAATARRHQTALGLVLSVVVVAALVLPPSGLRPKDNELTIVH
jgi:hypothetical protein